MLVSHKVRHEQLSSARGLGLEQAFEGGGWQLEFQVSTYR